MLDRTLFFLFMTEEQKKEQLTEPDVRLKNFFLGIWGLAKVFVVSALIILPIRAYVAQPFFVRGESMVPNFHDGEYLVIDELSYNLGLRSPRRGDVVVFRYPKDPSQFYIKRIIGLPGERVAINKEKIIIINSEYPKGLQLNEGQYLPTTDITDGVADIKLNANEYYVLGDNREHSSDSRYWGPVARNLIVGRAWLRLLPINEAAAFDTPRYGGTVPPAATAPAPL